jgi:hypothetical protein
MRAATAGEKLSWRPEPLPAFLVAAFLARLSAAGNSPAREAVIRGVVMWK